MSGEIPRTEPGSDLPERSPAELAEDATTAAEAVGVDTTPGAAQADVTGSADDPADAADPVAPADDAGAAADVVFAAAEALALAEARLADLQRERADFVNYRRRVERDREVAGAEGRGAVLAALLPVLDDIEGARAAGDLTGPFASVADKLQAVLLRQGLEPFGEVGEVFDPSLHEALLQDAATEVQEPTCTQVLQRGYRVGERVLRPARVAVASP